MDIDVMKKLEEIDKEYKSSQLEKKKLEKMKNAIEDYSKKIEISKNTIIMLKAQKDNAIINKDKVTEKDVQGKIDNENTKIENLKTSLKKMQMIIVNNQNKIDTQIAKISSDPEVKKIVDAAISKKVLRKNQRLLNENEQLIKIKELLEKHPNVKKQIIGMKNAEVRIKKLEDDKSKLDPVKDKSKIDKIDDDIKMAKDKYKNNKNIIISLAENDNCELEEKYLDKFIEGNFKINKGTGEYNIEASLNNRIKGNLKSIKNNEIILSSINGKSIKTTLRDDNHEMEVEVKNKGINLPANTKPKWYQFVTRFKKWRENKKISNNQKQSGEVYNKSEYENEISNSINKTFRNAYRLDVVKDYAEQREKELVKKMKNAKKAQEKSQQNDEER